MILNRTVNMAVFVGGLMSYLRYLCLLANSGFQRILCCDSCFVFRYLVYPMLVVSLDCPFLIATSVFSNVDVLRFYYNNWIDTSSGGLLVPGVSSTQWPMLRQ